MIRIRRRQLVQLYVFSDLTAILFSFLAAYWIRFQSGILPAAKGIPGWKEYMTALPIMALVQLAYFSYQDFYRMKLRRNRLDDLFMIIINSVLSSILVLLVFSYLKSYRFIGFEISHVFLAVYAAVSAFFIFEFRIIIFKFFKSVFMGRNGVSKILIAGEDELAEMTAVNLRKYAHFGIEVVGYLSPRKGDEVLGGYGDLERVVRKHGITDLFLALPLKEYDTIMNLIETGNNLLVDMRLVPDILQLASLKVGMEHIEGIPVIHLGDIPLVGWRAAMKRTFDIVVSFIGLIINLPVVLLATMLIKLGSPGPVFHVQTRVGLDGRIFKMIKFRTMIRDAEKETGPIWSPKGDVRVTWIGRILRKFSIDEIPQLINVFVGDMSLVGPRPERPELVEKFKGNIPRYMIRHRVKTGITGWAQVHGFRGNTPLDKRIEFDIYYIQNWTFRLDLEILFRTILKFEFVDRTI
jgi:exopolysaccharide biosynthesis polyprenyl glycosylphosphotransferase